jgi:transposase InsO family protein
MERWAVDILGPLPLTNKKNTYLMVVGDYFTKWKDAIPIRNKKATIIAQKFINHIVSIFGVPMQLHSDQGQTFESDVFQEVCKILGIEKTRSTPYRPQSDGMIERANRTIENMLSAFVDQNQKNWDDLIPLLMLAYRSAVHESTGVSPNEMVFGCSATLPVDLILGRADPKRYDQQLHSEYAHNLMQKLEKIHTFARDIDLTYP